MGSGRKQPFFQTTHARLSQTHNQTHSHTSDKHLDVKSSTDPLNHAHEPRENGHKNARRLPAGAGDGEVAAAGEAGEAAVVSALVAALLSPLPLALPLALAETLSLSLSLSFFGGSFWPDPPGLEAEPETEAEAEGDTATIEAKFEAETGAVTEEASASPLMCAFSCSTIGLCERALAIVIASLPLESVTAVFALAANSVVTELMLPSWVDHISAV